jgi:DNA (cytosine-5)-methyltransferase 1
MRFIDLFSGIGGFRLAMEKAGHECVGYCEIDKFARKSYQAIFDTEGEWTANDIRSVSDESIRGLGHIDVICGGFPCQAFSIAGKRKGFADTRGTLFFEIMRFASILRPRYLFCENVPGLLNHEGGDTFETILRAMDEVGYDAEWDCLNSKDYGVPQNRDRVFLIGHLREASTRKVFPFGESGTQTDEGRIIAGTLLAKYPGAQREGTYIETPREEIAIPVLTPDRLAKNQNGRRFKENGEPMFTLTGQDRHGVAVYDLYNKSERTDGTVGTLTANGNTSSTHCGSFGISDGIQIRKLTPRECWRLQGFPDWAFDRAQKVNSDSQLYKQAGNSVTVNVIYEIARRLA